MNTPRVDLSDPAARTRFEEFQKLPFVETHSGLAPQLTPEGLCVRLGLASELYFEAARSLEGGDFVDLVLPDDLPCPPTAEALMLALAQRELLHSVSPETDTPPPPACIQVAAVIP